MPSFARCLIPLVLGVFASRLGAQTIAAGDSALARGDTTAAIAAYEAAVAKHFDDAEARYRAGMLRMSRFDYHTNLSENRRKAEEHFQIAARTQSDSAKYWLALAEAFRTESSITVRAQVDRYISKALEAAHRFGSAVTADAEYQAGRVYWERYEPLAHEYVSFANQSIPGIDPGELYADWAYAENFFENRVRPIPPSMESGATDRIEAEHHLMASLAANPKMVRAAGLLAVEMGEQARWPEALDLTRRLVRAAPDSGMAWALWGMCLARADRWTEAQRTFDSALAHMTPRQRLPYDNLDRLLGDSGRRVYDSLGAAARAGFDTLYWRVAQPLYLIDRNESRTEFYTRITYVAYRWGDPLRGYEGYESDRGITYIRWGPPDVWAALGNDAAVGEMGYAMVWLYVPTKMRFLFNVQPTYALTTFSGNFRDFYHEAQNVRPVRYDNVAAVRNLDTVDVQVAEFRGDTARKTDVALYSFMPIGRMAKDAARLQLELQAAAFVKDGQMRDVVKEHQDTRIQGGDSLQVERRNWRMALAPSHYLMHVEARIPVLERAARHAASLDVRSFAGDSLMMSDLLLASRVAPRDSTAKRWTDFLVDPSAGRFKPSEPVSLLWEVYNLTPDSLGVARYKVEVRVTVNAIERHTVLAKIVGALGDAVGLSARGDNAAALAYDRTARIGPHGTQVEYLSLDLQGAPNATYDVAVAITDLVTSRFVISVPRRMTITATALQPANTPH